MLSPIQFKCRERTFKGLVLVDHTSRRYMERKCADTIGTVLVSWAGHF